MGIKPLSWWTAKEYEDDLTVKMGQEEAAVGWIMKHGYPWSVQYIGVNLFVVPCFRYFVEW